MFAVRNFITFGAANIATVLVVVGCGNVSEAVFITNPRPLTAVKSQPVTGPPSQTFWVEQLVDGLAAPWSMVWLPNGNQLIVEKYGGLRLMRGGNLDPKPIEGVPHSYQAAQSGLHDIVLDPDYARNQLIYLSFAEGDYNANHGVVYRARFNGSALVDGKSIFRSVPDKMRPGPGTGRMLFLPDKTLLIVVADDEQHKHLVQSTDNHFGKIIRINRDGSIPEDNPFNNKEGYLPEIYAIGFRTPLGLIRDPKDGAIWEVENGPRGGDEVNIIRKGKNYGWPLLTYGLDYSGKILAEKQEAAGFESPLYYWDPSSAPSGIALYRGGKYPGWDGDLFIGTLKGKSLRHIRLQGHKPISEEVLLSDLNERIRDVRVGPDGLLYLLTDNPNGRLLRLRPGTPPSEAGARVARPFVPSPGVTVGPGGRADPLEVVMNTPGDPVAGKKLFEQQCSSCHSMEQDAPPMPGPNLAGIIGRRYGSLPDFQYSPHLKMATGYWKETTLGLFLANPAGLIPGTTMGFQGLPDVVQRRDLITYMKQGQKVSEAEPPPETPPSK